MYAGRVESQEHFSSWYIICMCRGLFEMITLYTKNRCGFCIAAKDYLNKNELKFEEINIDNDPEAKKFLKTSGHKTCPQIYYSGSILVEGGCHGLLNLSKQEIEDRIQSFNLEDFDFDISYKL